MNCLLPNLDHMVKQEQYKDWLREAEQRRLTRAAATRRVPGPSQRPPGRLHKALHSISQQVLSLRPISRARV